MPLTDSDLGKIGRLMDERLLVFHKEVTDPKFEWLEGKLTNQINSMGKRLDKRIDDLDLKLSNEIGKLERKLDQVTDEQADKLDDYGKRIDKLELSVAI